MRRFRTALAAAAIMAVASTPALAGGMNKDIVDIAADNDQFETLVAAVQAADLVDTLKGDGPFTVFAPTDDAFAALPDGTLDVLLKPENKATLTAILTYHVVAGKVMSTDLQDDTTTPTVQGDTVAIDLDNGPMIDNANVVTADIEATNGVIHAIDAVILPDGVTIPSS